MIFEFDNILKSIFFSFICNQCRVLKMKLKSNDENKQNGHVSVKQKKIRNMLTISSRTWEYF